MANLNPLSISTRYLHVVPEQSPPEPFPSGFGRASVSPAALSPEHLPMNPVLPEQPAESAEPSPLLSDFLLADCRYEIAEVAAVIEPMLQAPQRCRFTSLYLQAIQTEHTTFLATNLVADRPTEVTAIASSWLVGRSSSCAVTIRHKTVSRCHAVISQHPGQGLYLTDAGSSNGTWVNRRRLRQSERHLLQDGDVIQFGKLTVEFFMANCRKIWETQLEEVRS